jgi:folate-binding protein YgfZ
MHSDWQQYLQSQGAQIDDRQVASFPDAPAAPDCALADLSPWGLIRLHGEDTRDFLQGQVTNDVREVSAEHSQLSGLCSPKGRMIANFRVFERDGDLFLQLPMERLEAVVKRLGMFVLRAKVELSDASDELVRIGIAGECAPDLLPCDAPQQPGDTVQHGDLTVIALGGDRPRFEIVGDFDAIKPLWEQSASVARPADPSFWPLMEIRAGVPTVFEQTVEAFVPQMTNMQLIDGVSFTKGCYTGQEVVARMQYLGKLKRRMYRARVDSETAPLPGDELFSSRSESAQGAGRVVDVQPSPDGGYEALVVVEIASVESDGESGSPTGVLTLGADNGPVLDLLDLPYPFPLEEAS